MNNFLALFDLIGELARRRYQAAERCFSVLGLNHTEARLLTLLAQEGGAATQETLSNLMFVDRSNAGRALKHLEQAGHIERRQDDANKRTNLVQITARGQTTVAEIAKIRSAMVQSFFGELTADEASSVVALLRKALANDDHA
jgi:MarR family transcriptional regulator, transcriptional regulator for hemolysin